MSPSKANNELWLCLRFSHLSLNSLEVAVEAEQAFAVSTQNKIWQCNTAAEQFGICNGMSINHALILQPALQLLERDLFIEQQSLKKLADWAYQYSSMIVLYNDHCLALEIGKSILLFNSLEQLTNLIKHDLNDMKMSVCIGISHTIKSAYVFSFAPHSKTAPKSLSKQMAKTAFAAIKIDHLEIDEKTKAKLHHCGFSSFRDLQNIDTVELGQRFGKEFLNYLEQLEGTKADPQTGVHPIENFEACLDFAEPISNLHWIEQQIKRLLADLHDFINSRQLFCRSFTWRFFHENNQLLDTVHIEMSSKHSTLASMLELSQLRLTQLNLKWEFSSIELTSKHLYLKTLFNDDLFDPKPDLEQFNQLIDKLSNRLGHTALFRLSHCAEQLPEMANTRQHINDNGIVKEDKAHYIKHTLKDQSQHQPLWLLANPKYLAQQNNKPIYKGPLNIINGPNRISSHWWSKPQSRDYYLARQINGRLLWVYFDRDKRNWYLHGLFS